MTTTAIRTDEQVAADNLRQAANLLSGGRWCTGDLYRIEETPSGHKKDKYCAVGALAVVMDPQVMLREGENSNGDVYAMDDAAYAVVGYSVAGKAVAVEIAKHYINKYGVDDMFDYLDSEDDSVPRTAEGYVEDVYGADVSEYIFNFNDDATEAKQVIDIFLAAAEALDPQKD